MELGIIGLGRMGGNISQRLTRAGHHCVVFDRSAEVVQKLAETGAVASSGLADMVAKLSGAAGGMGDAALGQDHRGHRS